MPFGNLETKTFSRHFLKVAEKNVGKLFSLRSSIPFDAGHLAKVVNIVDPHLPSEFGGIPDWLHIGFFGFPCCRLHVSRKVCHDYFDRSAFLWKLLTSCLPAPVATSLFHFSCALLAMPPSRGGRTSTPASTLPQFSVSSPS